MDKTKENDASDYELTLQYTSVDGLQKKPSSLVVPWIEANFSWDEQRKEK